METPTDKPPEKTAKPSVFATAWLSIWLQPRATIRRILDTNPRAYVWVLAALGGIGYGPGDGGEAMLSDLVAWLLYPLLGALAGLISLALIPYPIHWTGRWLGGEGTVVEIRCALAWSQIPTICLLPLSILIMYWLAGIHIPTGGSVPVGMPAPTGMVLGVISLIYLVVGIWQIVITVQTVAEAQRFSGWRSLANLILAALLISLVVLIPLMIVFWFGLHPPVAG